MSGAATHDLATKYMQNMAVLLGYVVVCDKHVRRREAICRFRTPLLLFTETPEDENR